MMMRMMAVMMAQVAARPFNEDAMAAYAARCAAELDGAQARPDLPPTALWAVCGSAAQCGGGLLQCDAGGMLQSDAGGRQNQTGESDAGGGRSRRGRTGGGRWQDCFSNRSTSRVELSVKSASE